MQSELLSKKILEKMIVIDIPTLLLLSFLLVREEADWMCGNGLTGWLELRQVAGREDGHSATRSTGS